MNSDTAAEITVGVYVVVGLLVAWIGISLDHQDNGDAEGWIFAAFAWPLLVGACVLFGGGWLLFMGPPKAIRWTARRVTEGRSTPARLRASIAELERELGFLPLPGDEDFDG